MYMPALNAAGTAWVPNVWDTTSNSNSPIKVASGNVANASAVATIPAVSAKTNVISGFDAYVGGATAGSQADITVSGLAGGSQTFPVAVPAGVTLGSMQSFSFNPPLVASASNTAIVVTMPALGAGNTKASVSARGSNF